MKPNDNEKSIMAEAYKKWGFYAQVDQCIEEMAELIQALIHAKRGRENSGGDNLAEELADVSIMIEQMIMIFELEVPVESFIDIKMERLELRITDHKRKVIG